MQRIRDDEPPAPPPMRSLRGDVPLPNPPKARPMCPWCKNTGLDRHATWRWNERVACDGHRANLFPDDEF